MSMPVLAYEASTQQIHTPVFDGPLELLLYLVRRKGVDIRFVKIAPITDAFLSHLKQLLVSTVLFFLQNQRLSLVTLNMVVFHLAPFTPVGNIPKTSVGSARRTIR